MCKPLAEGGLRCAASTRSSLRKQTFPGIGWDQAAAQHAATRSGAKELAADLAAAEQAGDMERVIAVRNALHRGAQIRQAAGEARDLMSERQRRQPSGQQSAAVVLAEDARTFTMAPDPTDPMFPGRAPVAHRSWDTAAPDYAPHHYVTPKIAKRINAGGPKNVDPTWHPEWETEEQWADGRVPRMGPEGLPLNPAGRTGLVGLGGCKRLGENKAADPVLTREDPATGKKQVLLGYKETERQWALPGGTVDEGEHPADACSRELLEEVGLTVNMREGRVVYQGFVDDHRNTDHAWFATQARHVHLTGPAANQNPVGSDDIAAARWVDLDTLRAGDLFAGHGNILNAAGLLNR